MATYDRRFHKATLYGDMFGGTEIWSTGFAIANQTGGDIANEPTDAEAQAIAEAFRTFWTTTLNGVSPSYRLLGAKVSMVSTTGTADPAFTHYHQLPTAAAGAGNVATLPPQIAVVATLATLKQRGAGSKGRMYLPGIGFGVGGDGKITSGNATQLANQMAIFLSAVNASTDVPGVVTLMSAERSGVPFRAAESNAVASVRVGTVYDTQRRRRNQLVEQYSSAALT